MRLFFGRPGGSVDNANRLDFKLAVGRHVDAEPDHLARRVPEGIDAVVVELAVAHGREGSGFLLAETAVAPLERLGPEQLPPAGLLAAHANLDVLCRRAADFEHRPEQDRIPADRAAAQGASFDTRPFDMPARGPAEQVSLLAESPLLDYLVLRRGLDLGHGKHHADCQDGAAGRNRHRHPSLNRHTTNK